MLVVASTNEGLSSLISGGGGQLQLYYSLKWDWAFGRDELGAPSGFIATLGAGHQAKRFAT
jgi:hypothetical protein